MVGALVGELGLNRLAVLTILLLNPIDTAVTAVLDDSALPYFQPINRLFHNSKGK